jgi:signal transduction histidine kinase
MRIQDHQKHLFQRSSRKQNTNRSLVISGIHSSWWHTPLVGYMLALVLVGIAFLITWLETLVTIHDYVIGIFFVMGTFLVAWFCGTGPGLMALVVGTICTDYLAIPPIHSFSFYLWPGLTSVIPFIMIQLLILWVIKQHKKNQTQLLLTQQDVSRYAEQVAASNQKLIESNGQLEEANRIKDQFLSMASHELRTPITSIHGHLQLLIRRLKKQGAQIPELLPVCETLAKVDHQTRRLTNLVDDLLDINSLRTRKELPETAQSDLLEVCNNVVAEQRFLSKRCITLHADSGPLFVQADAARLEQVLTNLISNALKYSPTESIVRVSVEQRSPSVRITVEDRGRGIPAEQVQSIFEPFYRTTDARSSSVSGTGLGLTICQEIVEHYHGKIWCESTSGVGSRFFVELPLTSQA